MGNFFKDIFDFHKDVFDFKKDTAKKASEKSGIGIPGMPGGDSGGMGGITDILGGIGGGGITGLLGGGGIGDIFGGGGGDSLGEKLFGKKVVVPEYPELDTAQTKAIAANKKSLPEIKKLASELNRFNQAELLAMLEETLPGGTEQIQKNIMADLRGEVSPDTQRSLQRYAAERAVRGGYAGTDASNPSGMKQNLEWRDFGIASDMARQRGMASADRWMARAKAPTYDPTAMFITPGQQYDAAVGKFGRDLHAANIEAAPDPVARGMFDTTMTLAGMAMGIYSGGPGYRNTYNPQATNNNYPGGAGGGGGGGGSYLPQNSYQDNSSSYGGWDEETTKRNKLFGFV